MGNQVGRHKPDLVACACTWKEVALATGSDAVVAIAAVHRSALAGLERNLSLLATLSARSGEHRAPGAVAG